MKLKTINDFDKDYGFCSGDFSKIMKDFQLDEDCASETQHVLSHLIGDLKKEVIKWIQQEEEFRKETEKSQPIEWKDEHEDCFKLGRISILKEFHNITEEDLK